MQKYNFRIRIEDGLIITTYFGSVEAGTEELARQAACDLYKDKIIVSIFVTSERRYNDL